VSCSNAGSIQSFARLPKRAIKTPQAIPNLARREEMMKRFQISPHFKSGLHLPKGGSSATLVKRRRQNSGSTRDRILKAAYEEFAYYGFAGARVDRINSRAKANQRMLYHLFGSKEQLYQAVLLEAYTNIRSKEAALDIEHLGPIEGIVALFDFTFDHFAENPQFIWLLTNENLMRGKFVLSTTAVTDLTSPLRSSLERLVKDGVAAGILSPGTDPVQIYVTIASLSWFHLSNAYTLSAMFGRDLTSAKWRAARKEVARKVLLAYLSGGRNKATVKRTENGIQRSKSRPGHTSARKTARPPGDRPGGP
jgi:AcrR family transcriptional regulator